MMRVDARRPSRSCAPCTARRRLLAGPLLVLALGGCGSDAAAEIELGTQAVVGGTTTESCEWPAVVALGGCTGTLVHPRLVLYAEHCGTAIEAVRFGTRSDAPERVVPTSVCRGYPGARLGDGTDLAFCVLAEAVEDVEPARIVAGCEEREVQVGAEVTVVGYGLEQPNGAYGVQRVGVSSIAAIGDEILLEDGSVDTCRGDSGGPVFLAVTEADGSASWRLVGITSAGSESVCGSGLGHYVHVSRHLDWLEEASGLDLTPCFDAGAWAPTPACRSITGMRPEQGADEGASGCEPVAAAEPLATCGDAWSAPPDREPPRVERLTPSGAAIHHVLPSDEPYLEMEVVLEASDEGWGVEQVAFSLLDREDAVLFSRVDQIRPYALPVLRLPPGDYRLISEVRDYAGHVSTDVLSIEVTTEQSSSSGACSVLHGPRGPAGLGYGWAVALGGVWLAARRRRGSGQGR